MKNSLSAQLLLHFERNGIPFVNNSKRSKNQNDQRLARNQSDTFVAFFPRGEIVWDGAVTGLVPSMFTAHYGGAAAIKLLKKHIYLCENIRAASLRHK